MSSSESLDERMEDARRILSGMITGKARGQNGKPWEQHFESMHNYVQRLDLTAPLRTLPVIHVAGTKGKGSTCAMAESILRGCGYRTGLYTSPHLVDVRERIRIDGRPVDPERFLTELEWCQTRLEGTVSDAVGMPAYFRFLTLLAFRVFLKEDVDVAVLEVGMGGRLDATNVIPPPWVSGITPIGFDHMEVLGDTLAKIATEKAGILKPGTEAWSSPQEPEAWAAIQAAAAARGGAGGAIPVRLPPPLSHYSLEPGSPALTVGQRGAHMSDNASLAVVLAAGWERRAKGGGVAPRGGAGGRVEERLVLLEKGILPREYCEGINRTQWPGRSQVLPDSDLDPNSLPTPHAPNLTYYLDGAHTPESMQVAADWFAQATQEAAAAKPPPPPPPQAAGVAPAAPAAAAAAAGRGDSACAPSSSTPDQQRVLVFNCMAERSPAVLLGSLRRRLAERGVAFDAAVFVPGVSSTKKLGGSSSPPPELDLSWQQGMQRVWASDSPPSSPSVSASQPATAAPTAVSQASQAIASQAGVAAWASLPPQSLADPVGGVGRGTVMPSLQSALDWLRRSARSRPAARYQVLITGSLYLVGDVLRNKKPE